MPVYNVWEASGIKVPPPNERVLKVILSPEVSGTENLTLLISVISPHSTTGLHTHDQDEIMYVASGYGESIQGDDKAPLQPDTIIHSIAGVNHEVKNTSDDTMKLVCFFSPPLKVGGAYGEAIELAKKAYEK